jgi:adenylate cyclase
MDSDWIRLHRAHRTILVVDMVESVRLLEVSESDVIDRWRRFVMEMSAEVLPSRHGRMVKSLGDGMLIEFNGIQEAVEAAHEAHRRIERFNVGNGVEDSIYLRAGIHAAEVVVDDIDIYGAGVNLASRLASLASPGQTVGSEAVRGAVVPGLDADIHDLGECFVKHVDKPVRAYLFAPPGSSSQAHPARYELPKALLLRPSLAVLTFSGAGADDLMGKMLADEFATQASANGAVDVLSRMSTRRYRPEAEGQGALKFLRHLNVVYGIAGSCLERGGQIYLQLELVNVSNDTVLWAKSARFSSADALMRPAEVIASLRADALREIVSNETRRVCSEPIESLESYALLLGGVNLMHRQTKDDFDRGRQLLEAVAERVPRHPDAYAWLSKWYILESQQGWSSDRERTTSRASDCAARALQRDPRNALALTTAGMVETYFHRRLDKGEALYADAIAANPNEALAWSVKGMLHAFRGEGAQAMHDTRRALSLTPVDPFRYFYDSLCASAAIAAGEYDEAITMAQRSIQSNRMHSSTWRVIVVAATMLGRKEVAARALARHMELEPAFTVKRFLERTPAADYEISRVFASALERAGVPLA